ncbi:MAG: PqqD family protein [Gemmatimonadaceae bacterium]
MLPRPKSSVVYRPMPDGGVLFSPTEETYFGLNQAGACIWENLSPVRNSVEEVCAEVSRRFPDAQPEQVRTDVGKLLDELTESGLVESV